MAHHWISIALGRVCSVCQQVQAFDEFDDESTCSGEPHAERKPPPPKKQLPSS